MKGISDCRGRLFYDYINIINEKRPEFFVIENVPGIVSKTHINEFKKIHNMLEYLNSTKKQYNISYNLINAKYYGVPQDRKRVFLIGYRTDLNKLFKFPEKSNTILTLKDAIFDFPESTPAEPYVNNNLEVPNHEHLVSSFSSMYMSRNRVRKWNEPSFTIQAGGRHAPLHPDSKMIKLNKDKWAFIENPHNRRLSVRECARIQTFPDEFIFYYSNILSGYRMIGNAVPVNLSNIIAKKIYFDLYDH